MIMDSLGATNNPSVTDGNSNSKWVVYDLNLIAAPAPELGSLLPLFGLGI
jgi:hypothetical protein